MELVSMGRFPYTGWLGKLDQSDKKAIHDAVEQTGITHLLAKSLHELSDGERQKVMIARALAQDTPVIILDEPTAFLDLPSRYEILRILNDLTVNNNKTVLFSTHDLSIALDVADKIWLMAENEIFEGAPEDLLISKVFRKLFLNSPAEFDPASSTFRFSREMHKMVEIRGVKKYNLLTRRAMERIGIGMTENESETIVEIAEQQGKPVWHLRSAEYDMDFYSIYNLVAHLKTHH
jgi:iron complex transport system ATP-binding protein